MLKAICHEDFYTSGTWGDESLGVYVGWTALKHSFCDGMPLCNEGKDICLIFSGEDYSDRRTIRGHENGNGRAEAAYLIRQCEQKPNFIQSLNGLFHGVIANRRSGKVTLFNDRYGMHRLCYYAANDGFYFGAEAKAILAVHRELAEVDYKSLGEFASFSCVLENRTIFKGIKVLPGASVWTFSNAELVCKNVYFNPIEWEEQQSLEPNGYYEELRSTLAAKLPHYFAGKQKIGIALTGGFDTRVILALHSPPPRSLPCYTFGGPIRESQDVLVGRKVAGICQQTHQVIEVGNDFLTSFPDYAKRTVFLTEGTVDVSRADLYLSERAREIAPAKIVGTYGSEIVRHAVMFKPVEPTAGLLSPDFVPYVREAASTYAAVRSRHPVTFAAFSQSPWYHHGVLALEKSQLTVRSPFLDNDFVRTVYRAPKGDPANRDIRLQLIRGASPALGRVPSDRGIRANGAGFLSVPPRAFQEFTFKAEYAYDYGMPQSVARVDHFFSALRLQRLFLGRHKFLHFRVWYRDQLSNYIREMLLDSLALSRPYVQKKRVESMLARHLRGDRNYTTEVHRLLTMELLHRIFVDNRRLY